MDFAVPVDHKVKIKENEKIDKYLDLARRPNIVIVNEKKKKQNKKKRERVE